MILDYYLLMGYEWYQTILIADSSQTSYNLKQLRGENPNNRLLIKNNFMIFYEKFLAITMFIKF